MTDLQDALKLLPHGPEFRFLTRLLGLVPGKHGTAEYRIPDAPNSKDASPRPFPAVLLLEAGAQLAGVVAQNDPSVPALPGLKLASIRRVRILESVLAGATIRLEASVTGRLGQLVQAQASAFVEERTVMSAEFTLSGTVTAPKCATEPGDQGNALPAGA